MKRKALLAEQRETRRHLGGIYTDLPLPEAVRLMLLDARAIRDMRIAERDRRIERLEAKVRALREELGTLVEEQQFAHLRNPDGSVNRAAFAVLRGDTLAPYVTAPREGEGTMTDPTPTPAPEPGTPPPPPDA